MLIDKKKAYFTIFVVKPRLLFVKLKSVKCTLYEIVKYILIKTYSICDVIYRLTAILKFETVKLI